MWQKVIFVGHLGRDPKEHFNPKTGTRGATFSVASNRKYKLEDGTLVEETTWFRVTTWGRQAEVCLQYLRKGRLVLVEGRLKCDPKTGGPRIFTREDGTPGAANEVSAELVRFLDKNGVEEGVVGADPGATDEAPPPPEEELPF